VRYAGQYNGSTYAAIYATDASAGEVPSGSRVISNSTGGSTDYGLYATNSRVVVERHALCR